MSDPVNNNIVEPNGYISSQLSTLEEQILDDWGSDGLPNVEAIHELGCDLLRLAIMDMGEPLHPRAIPPDEDELCEELFKMLEKIPPENSALDVVYKIRSFVHENAKYRDPSES